MSKPSEPFKYSDMREGIVRDSANVPGVLFYLLPSTNVYNFSIFHLIA